MSQYWDSLTILQQVFLIMAVPSTLFLILQALMAIAGVDGLLGDHIDIHHEIPHDVPSDVPSDGHGDMSATGHHIGFLNSKSIVAFFVVGGWIGFILADKDFSPLIAITIAFLSGIVSLVLATLLIRKLLGLQSSGNMKLEYAIGKNADVYLKIGPKSTDIGKVTLTVSGRFSEFNAITMGNKIFKTGDKVCVIDIAENGILVVEDAL